MSKTVFNFFIAHLNNKRDGVIQLSSFFIKGFLFSLGFGVIFGPPFLWGVDTQIKGARMEIINKGETVIFSGGVRMTRGTDVLTAKKMTTDKKRENINAIGNVKLTRTLPQGEKWQGFGKKGFYNTVKGTGYLLGGMKKAHVIYTEVLSSTMTRKIDIYSQRFDFSRPKEKSVAKGKVYGKSRDPETNELHEFWSDKAEYFRGEKKITLSGKSQPKVRQSKGKTEKIITGDVIFYYIDTERFVSEGDAQAVFIEPSQKEN